jgi:hypothetical protein
MAEPADRRCGDLRDDLAEVALGVRDPVEVPGLEAHLRSCAACRAELAQLSTTADRLVLLVPEADPPGGFEARAVAAMTAGADPIDADPAAAGPFDHAQRRRRARRPVLVGVAAAVVLVLAVGGAVVVAVRGSGPEVDRSPVAATAPGRFVTADGRTVGRLQVAGGTPATMTVSLHGVEPGVEYTCRVVLGDGSHRDVGTWLVSGPDAAWTVAVPEGATAGQRVELVRADGAEVAVAALPASL